jgi:hypothetical protein
MTKKQIKALADLYAASVVYNSLGNGASAEGMTDSEHEQFQHEVNVLAERMAAKRGELGTLSLSYGTLDDLANFCKENY